MHNMEMYESLRDMLEKEVKEIQKEGNLDIQKLDNLYKLLSALDDVNECIEKETMDGASYAGRYRNRGSYERNRGSYERGGGSYGGSYERGGGSYERGGMSNDYSMMMPYAMGQMAYGRVDGDGDGRYYESRDNFRNRSNRGRSNESSYEYSRDNAKRKMVQKLETLMDDTMSEYDRNAIMDCIEKIK